MGELIALRPRSRAGTKAASARKRGETAEILFFTGVRFARYEDYVQEPKKIRRRGARRAAKPDPKGKVRA
ncbi:MAG TPA: hypothetical protein VKV77_03110 [Methylovirgula sp.]|nr:hypothetical protein [Methylovirgula sp.]